MKRGEYVTIPQLAKILGISRVAVYKKVKKGRIKAVRIGRNFAISRKQLTNILGKALSKEDKSQIDTAVKKAIAEYGETLRLLGTQ
jgi:excisionase family DNA binding protein